MVLIPMPSLNSPQQMSGLNPASNNDTFAGLFTIETNMQITYFGHSCFLVDIGGYKILFDPFISQNELAKDIDITHVSRLYFAEPCPQRPFCRCRIHCQKVQHFNCGSLGNSPPFRRPGFKNPSYEHRWKMAFRIRDPTHDTCNAFQQLPNGKYEEFQQLYLKTTNIRSIIRAIQACFQI